MRLWHEALIPYLPRQQLLGLHREVCALRGNGWGRKHATVNYVFEHPTGWLVAYHKLVMREMERRGYSPNQKWYETSYRGKNKPEIDGFAFLRVFYDEYSRAGTSPIYPEHNAAYLQECLDNLASKGIHIDMEASK